MPLAVGVRTDEARAERGDRERPAPRPDVDRGADLREPAAKEAVVQVRLVGFEDPLAVLQAACDDERRVDDRDGEHEQREEQRDDRRGLEQALQWDRREHEPE